MTAIAHEQAAASNGSGLVRYRQTLRTPGALAFAVPGVIGRLPMAMLSLALVILLTAVTGSYGIAGAVSAAAALAYAAMTPVVGPAGRPARAGPGAAPAGDR